MTRDEQNSGISLTELLASYSLAIDLGLGQPMEHLLGAWQIADGIADQLAMTDDERDAIFYIAMLAWVGCVADTPAVAATFGDDIRFRGDSYNVDFAGLPAFMFVLGHAGTGRPTATRIEAVLRLMATGARKVAGGIKSHCITTAAMANQLGLDEDVAEALKLYFARWDGRGVPANVAGEQIPATVRIFQLADVLEVHHREHGPEAAIAVARERRGGQFDPAVVDAFCAAAGDVLSACGDADCWALLATRPALASSLSESELDSALEVLADFTDLRSTFRAGHSRAVADLAVSAANDLGLPADDVTDLRRGALLHDIGMHGLPATILDKPGPLTATEAERVRLSSYYTRRVLSRPAALAGVGAIAAMAGERMNGSGYDRGLPGASIPMTGRVLAAACTYRESTEGRSHLPAVTGAEAAQLLRREVRAGKFDADAVEAVLAAAGNSRRRRPAGPAGLTPREVEVLCLIARGASTSDVARELVISKKTAGAHIERIYTKTGASSRSTATLFALRNGLLGDLEITVVSQT
jgi:HD-GYP domain-containing protein (c-di-GMP phosphodiesterase class II)